MYRMFIPPYFSLHICCNLIPMARPSLKNEIWSYADLNSVRQTHADKGITFSSQELSQTPRKKKLLANEIPFPSCEKMLWIHWPLEKNLPLLHHDWDGIFISDFLVFRIILLFFFMSFSLGFVFVKKLFSSRFPSEKPDPRCFAKVETDINSNEIFFPQFRTRPNAML